MRGGVEEGRWEGGRDEAEAVTRTDLSLSLSLSLSLIFSLSLSRTHALSLSHSHSLSLSLFLSFSPSHTPPAQQTRGRECDARRSMAFIGLGRLAEALKGLQVFLQARRPHPHARTHAHARTRTRTLARTRTHARTHADARTYRIRTHLCFLRHCPAPSRLYEGGSILPSESRVTPPPPQPHPCVRGARSSLLRKGRCA